MTISLATLIGGSVVIAIIAMNNTARADQSLSTVENSASGGDADPAQDQCKVVPFMVKLRFGRTDLPISLPSTGSFVEESHYVTTQDESSLDASYPAPMEVQPVSERAVQCDEGIEAHLQRSLKLYQAWQPEATLESMYPHPWQRVWTPQEGGECGQGSIGDRQLELLTPDKELWLLTMQWAPGQKPEPDTRFLLSYSGRHVVVLAGYETGPRKRRYLGGVTPEVHAWLGTLNNTRDITIGYPINQTLAPGPIACGGDLLHVQRTE